MSKIYLVRGYCGEYEPSVWDVRAFIRKADAEFLIEEYTNQVRVIEDQVAEYEEANEEPDINDDSLTGEWFAWIEARRDIRKTHPDENTHDEIENTYYTIIEVDFVHDEQESNDP